MWTGRLQLVHDCLELVVLALLISAVVLSYLTCVPPYSEDIPPATTTTLAASTVTTTTVTTALSCMTPGCTISITIVEPPLIFTETVQTRVCRYSLGLAHDVAEAWEKNLHVAVLLFFLLMVIIRVYTSLTKPSREKSIPPALTCPKCGSTTEYSISGRYYCSNCQRSFSREVEV